MSKCLFIVMLAGSVALAQTPGRPTSTKITGRAWSTSGENGITVGVPKVFDFRTLTLMLESLNDTLKGLQVIDQDPLKKALGLLQGSRTEDVARSFSILGGGSPKVVTKEESSQQSDDNEKETKTEGTKDDKTTDLIESIVEKKLSEKLGLTTEKTISERVPSAPNLPDLIASPTGAPAFAQSPADLLTDQVNLSYQIFNIRMMLDGSLSDRVSVKGQTRLQTVLGFNVSIDPTRDTADAAAMVEITIQSLHGERVSLVSLMPQEKTYNSVALSTKSTAFGGAAVARMINVGYSERRRGQNFYLYRDNDTLSFERMMSAEGELTFGWQFRPVLGRRSVSPGLRQMFAVISIPESDVRGSTGSISLKVRTRTYWRKYYAAMLTSADRSDIGPWPHLRRIFSLGVSRSVPNGMEAWRTEDVVDVPTTTEYQKDLAPTVNGVRWVQVNGTTALVSVTGSNFFTATSVVVGGTIHSAAAGNLIIKSTQAMDILTPIENVGAGDAAVIGRYGSATSLETPLQCQASVDPTKSRLSLPFAGRRELDLVLIHNCPSGTEFDQQFVVFANGKKVPERAAALTLDETRLRITTSIPLAQFPKAEGSISVVYPFHGWRISFPWNDPAAAYEIQRFNGETKTTLLILRKDLPFDHSIFEGRTWDVRIGDQTFTRSPKGYVFELDIDKTDLEGQLLLLEPKPSPEVGQNPYLFDIPAGKPKPKIAIEPAAGISLTIAQNDAPKLDFTGERVGDVDLKSVIIEGKEPLRAEYDSNKKTLSVWMTQDVTKLPAENVALQFRDSDGKLIATLKLQIKATPKPAATVGKPMNGGSRD